MELKAVNGRFLKVVARVPPCMGPQESLVETWLRDDIKRGSVTATVRVDFEAAQSAAPINEELVRIYQEAFRRLGLREDRIPELPGVIGDSTVPALEEPQLAVVRLAAKAATEALVSMRETEGRALAETLLGLIQRVEGVVGRIGARAPQVVEEYHEKLRARVERLLEGTSTKEILHPEQLAREVALFADRSDITEEVDRMASHIAQARQLLGEGGVVGRTLEFVAQEMHREINTVGSKSSDAEVARAVVEVKADLERLKEQLANIE